MQIVDQRTICGRLAVEDPFESIYFLKYLTIK